MKLVKTWKNTVMSIMALLLLCPFISISAAETDSWSAHMSYHDASAALKAFGRIYVLSDASLYSYNPDDTEIVTYDKVWPLSDVNISAFAYCAATRTVILVYENGNIDFLYQDDSVYNLTDLKRSSITDKKTNSVSIEGKYAYICTASCLVIADTEKKEIKSTCLDGIDCLSATVIDNTLFCTTTSGFYSVSLDDNILDFSKWTQLRPYYLDKIMNLDGTITGISYDKLYTVDKVTGAFKKIRDGISCFNWQNGILEFTDSDSIYIYTSINNHKSVKFSDNEMKSMFIDGNTMWLCRGNNGLSKYDIGTGQAILKSSEILPDSPRRNNFNTVFVDDDERLLAVGGEQNYSGIVYPGTVMSYKDNTWSYFDDDISSKTGLKYIDLTSMAIDPDDPEHIFIGSARQGLYEFKNGNFIKLHTFDNSALSTIIPEHPYDFVSVNALSYDNDGNLWMMNNEVDTIIKILRPDGSWTSLYYPEIKGMPTFTKTMFDSNGLMWTNSSRYNPGLFCLDINGTLEDTTDDRHKFSGATFTNQDGTSVTVNYIYFFEQDIDGIMWIGTDKGIFTLEKPQNFIDENNTIFKRIKIPRNDGTGQADYLMNGVYTTCIYIDPANRKWIGTMSDGIFLLSSDGIETIHHFTADNSPLLSDYIHSIAMNKATGEIFIGTDAGLNIFVSDASKGAEKLKKSNITVYPNPAVINKTEIITIKGLSPDCTVKVLSASGRLLYESKSNGGTFTWNLRDYSGHYVSSGIYTILAIDQDSENSAMSKFAVIR